jgi:hypothetical protein
MRAPTLKDVSSAIAHPITLLGYCRDAAGTHGVRGSVYVNGARPVELSSMTELERLSVAISRARAAEGACSRLAEILELRRDAIRARAERRT